MRACIYLRVSTKRQGDHGFSLDAQREACKAYAAERGYELVGEFVEKFSGEGPDRPAMRDLQSYLESNGFDVLVCHHLDRLGRTTLALAVLEQFFSSHGVAVEFVLNDYSGEMGTIRKEVDQFIAQIERSTRLRRTSMGKIKAARSGVYVGGVPPYGYRHDKSVKGGLSVVEDQALIVRRIFCEVADGKSIRAVVRDLTAESIPSPRGGPWGTSSIARILNNKVYTGTSVYNARKRDGKRLKDRPIEEHIEIAVTPIIGLEEFKRAQNVLIDNQRFKRLRTDRTYLLSGLIVCADCGRAFVASTRLAGQNRRGNDAVIYRHRLLHGHCRNQQISGRIVESQVWEDVRKILIDPEGLKKRLDALSSGQQKQRDTLTEKIAALEKQRIRYETKLNNLLSAFTDPDLRLSKSQYLQQREQTQTMLTTVEDGIDDLRSQLDQIEKPFDIDGLEEMIREMHNDIGDQDVWEIMVGVERGIEIEAAESFPEFKREIFERLHIRVAVDSQGGINLLGDVKPVGTMSTQSGRCDCPPLRSPARV